MKIKYYIFIIGIFILVPLINAGNIGDNSTTTWFVQGGVDCVGNGYYWNDSRDVFNIVTTNTMGSGGNCYNPIGSSTQFCCPSGYQCNDSGFMGPSGPVYNCTYTNVFYCSQLTGSGMCANATGVIASNTATTNGVTCGAGPVYSTGGGFCQNITSCSCGWNGVNCTGHYSTIVSCSSGSPARTCNISSTFEDRCNETGIIIDHITAVGDPTLDYCHNDTKQISCDDMVKLNFFSTTNLIIAVILLIVIYGIYILRKNKKLDKSKKKLVKKKR